MRYILTVTILAITGSAFATEAIDQGEIKKLAYRASHVLFQVNDGTTNKCGSCAADPAGYHSGGFCWVQSSNTTLVSLLMSAQAQKATFKGRVTSWTTCELYQAEIVD